MGDVWYGDCLGVLGRRQGLGVLGLPHGHREQVGGARGRDTGGPGSAGSCAPPPSRHHWHLPLIGLLESLLSSDWSAKESLLSSDWSARESLLSSDWSARESLIGPLIGCVCSATNRTILLLCAKNVRQSELSL